MAVNKADLFWRVIGVVSSIVAIILAIYFSSLSQADANLNLQIQELKTCKEKDHATLNQELNKINERIAYMGERLARVEENTEQIKKNTSR